MRKDVCEDVIRQYEVLFEGEVEREDVRMDE